jgi:uncharacterized membrane protein
VEQLDWLALWQRHRGKILGSALGFAVAVAIKQWGILWTLFVALAVAVGYTVGRYADGEQEGLGVWIDRLLPPGRR